MHFKKNFKKEFLKFVFKMNLTIKIKLKFIITMYFEVKSIALRMCTLFFGKILMIIDEK